MPDDRILQSLYEQDLDAWALTQAAALRSVGGVVSRGENQPLDLLRSLDWGNLAEEIEGLASKDRREVGSRLSVIVEHLAELEFSSHTAPRSGWIDTVAREREEIAEILHDSPSLRREVGGILGRRAETAIQRAISALAGQGEVARPQRLG
jgi:hypothetical protein